MGPGIAGLRDHRAWAGDRCDRPDPGHRVEYEIHYWLASDRTGRGYVTEAAQALLVWAPEALGTKRIVLHAGMENRRSLAIAERLGFTRDGELEGGMTGGSVAIFPAYSHHLDL